MKRLRRDRESGRETESGRGSGETETGIGGETGTAIGTGRGGVAGPRTGSERGTVGTVTEEETGERTHKHISILSV